MINVLKWEILESIQETALYPPRLRADENKSSKPKWCVGPDNDLSYSTEKPLKAAQLLINLLIFTSKFNFFILLCGSGAGPYKHFSFASWLGIKFCQQSAGRTLQTERGLFFWFYCALAVLKAGSTQQHEGHSVAPNLQQGSAEWLWVASQKILLVPQLALQWMWDNCPAGSIPANSTNTQ